MLLRGVGARTLRAANFVMAATFARQRAFLHQLSINPELVTVGTPLSPSFEVLRPGLVDSVSPTPRAAVLPLETGANTDKSDGKQLVDGAGTLLRGGFMQLLPSKLLGMWKSTLAGTTILPPFVLAAALERPDKVALWTLKPETPIPEPLVVLSDHWPSDTMVWAPREPMELSAYQAALASVGRDADGKPRDWTRWDNSAALVSSLPMSADEQASLTAQANAQRALCRTVPESSAEFVGRALLTMCFASVGTEEVAANGTGSMAFLSAMAELAVIIPHNPDVYRAFAHTCRRLNELRYAEAASEAEAQSPMPQSPIATDAARAKVKADTASAAVPQPAEPATREAAVGDPVEDFAIGWWRSNAYRFQSPPAAAAAAAVASSDSEPKSASAISSESAAAAAAYFSSRHLTISKVHALAYFTGIGGADGAALMQRRDLLFVERALTAASRGVLVGGFEILRDINEPEGEGVLHDAVMDETEYRCQLSDDAARELGFRNLSLLY